MEHELFTVMKIDATLSSHPIISQVDHPDQITEIFDGISYNKVIIMETIVFLFIYFYNFYCSKQ